MKRPPREYRFRGYRLRFNRTLVMGILNITPDSFSDGGRYFDPAAAIAHARALADEGADILDVGGESSRPGAAPVAEEEELRRVIPVIREVVRAHPSVPVSIDTYKPRVARTALEAGAAIINDISGLRDPAMVSLAAEAGVPVVVMHMRGTPQTMQRRPAYRDVVEDIRSYFLERIKTLTARGVNKIILDPGIGFGKTANHNLAILNRLERLCGLGYPVLVGVSRKSFIGASLGAKVGARGPGAIAANVIAITKGARMIRVHGVADNLQAARMAEFIIRGKKKG